MDTVESVRNNGPIPEIMDGALDRAGMMYDARSPSPPSSVPGNTVPGSMESVLAIEFANVALNELVLGKPSNGRCGDWFCETDCMILARRA